MGVVWEAYHKGVPLLGVPENPIDKTLDMGNGWVGPFFPCGHVLLRFGRSL